MIIRIFLLSVLLFALATCQDRDDDALVIAVEEMEEIDTPTVEPIGTESYLEGNSDYIFDQNKLHTFELKIAEDQLAIIDQDPAAEEFVEGTLIFEGDTISPVGVRYKGSVGAFVGCLSGPNPFSPSGSKVCTKLSMKVKINWKGREEKFFDLKKLQFHSMNNDPSQMRERLGYHLFGEMGVSTPRAVHARLLINGEYAGLFALVEQIDNRFVKYNFDDDDGNLYKEIWPISMEGAPFSDQEYRDALKTNEGNNTNVDIIRNFAQSIADADLAEGRMIVEQRMNLEDALSYAAVDRTIRHDDGPFHWYCFGGECASHNFYWYEEPGAEKLHLIPWDLDHAFENIRANVNPVTAIADAWGASQNNCEPFNSGPFSLVQWSASCDKLTQVWNTYEVKYLQAKQEFINGPFAQSEVDQLLNDWQNQIREATTEANDSHDDAISIGEWESAMSELQDQLEFARNN